MTAATVPVRRDRALLSVSALLWGVQFAFLNPAIGIILVTLYDATPGQVGLALASYNVSGFVSTLVVPTRADPRATTSARCCGAVSSRSCSSRPWRCRARSRRPSSHSSRWAARQVSASG